MCDTTIGQNAIEKECLQSAFQMRCSIVVAANFGRKKNERRAAVFSGATHAI